MIFFLKRLVVLFLIPAGIVLLFLPLNLSRQSDLGTFCVFLSAGPVSPEDKKIDTTRQLTREQLEHYVPIFEMVLERKKIVDSYLPSREVTGDIPGLESLGKTLSEMDGVPPEEAKQYKENLGKSQKRIRNTQNETNRIRQTSFSYEQERWKTEPTSIPVGEWNQMKETLLLSDEDKPSFIFENTLYQGFVEYSFNSPKIPVPGLTFGRKIAGAVFLCVGLLLMAGLYQKKQGIMISRTWCVVLWDIITMSISVFFVYGAIDLVFMKLFGTRMCTEEFVQFMGVFWVFIAIPCVTLFIAASAAQAVTINEKGLYPDGLFSKRFVAWDELTSIEVTELHSVKRAGGIIAPKQLMKIMRLDGETSSITLMEPPLKSIKKRILEAMITHAPQEWKERIAEEGKVWLAYF